MRTVEEIAEQVVDYVLEVYQPQLPEGSFPDIKNSVIHEVKIKLTTLETKVREEELNYLREYHSNMRKELRNDPNNEYIKGGLRVLTLVGRHFEELSQTKESV